MRLDVLGRIEEVGEDAWERLAPAAGFYLSYRWLRAVERDSAFVPQYVVATGDDGAVAGLLPAYLWSGDGGWVVDAYEPAWFAGSVLREDISREDWFPLLLVGTRAGYSNEPLLEPSLSEDERSAVVETLVEGALALGEELGAQASAALYLTPAGAGALAGVPVVLWAAGTAMPVQWGSFDDYVAALSAHRRASVRRERRRFAESGAAARVCRLSDLGADAARLQGNVQRRHGRSDTDDALAALLAAQAGELDHESRVFLAERDGHVLGFALAFEYSGTLYMRSVGFDYELLGSEDAYFNVCYYEPIRYAAETGLRAIDFGLASYGPKLVRGARPFPLYTAVWPPEAYADRWHEAVPRWNTGSFEWWNGELGRFAVPLEREEWLPAGVPVA